MELLVDTSVLIAMERAGRPLGELTLAWPAETFALAAITASELLFGVRQAKTPDRRARREAFIEAAFQTLTVISFDLDIARVHAELGVELRATGRTIGLPDSLIAATALARGAAILTENRREFENVPNLDVRTPVW